MKFTGNGASDPSGCFPPGEYFLKCTNVQHQDDQGNNRKSKSGNISWILEMTVSEGPHENRKLWHYLNFIPAGASGHGMALKCLKAFGIDPEGENDILPELFQDVITKADVIIDDKNPAYDPKNVVKKWHVPGELAKPSTAQASEADAGSAQDPDEFDHKKLEKQAPAAKPAAPAAAPKKTLWGGKK